MRWQEGVCPNMDGACFCTGVCRGKWVPIESEAELLPLGEGVIEFPVTTRDPVEVLVERTERLVALLYDLKINHQLLNDTTEWVQKALDELEESWTQ